LANLAGVVTLADLEDHLADPSTAPISTPPPYAWARRTIVRSRPKTPSPMPELLPSAT
jgi:hypothetical protein